MKDPVFRWGASSSKRAREHARDLVDAHPGSFPSVQSAMQWMRQITLPKSRRWAYRGNGKSGSSSTKRFLFELEFGAPLTVEAKLEHDINPDALSHFIQNADVFRLLVDFEAGPVILDSALRLTTVRDPKDRALSSFQYLCESHHRQHQWFAADRVRMNAVVGFNWNTEPDTEKGFGKFLEFIAHEMQFGGTDAVNPHWRPQVGNIRPGVFRPDIVGRLEAFQQFTAEVANRLSAPMPAEWEVPHANSTTRDRLALREGLLSRENERRVETVYQLDFEAFGY